MYERMLNKQQKPTIEEMTEYCGENAECFTLLNRWLTVSFGTEQRQVFPYGNGYGWGIAHRIKGKLICNVFAENNSLTVMVRLSDKQWGEVYDRVQKYTQEYIDNKYPCGDGGWIHCRITLREHFEDIKILLTVKCEKYAVQKMS